MYENFKPEKDYFISNRLYLKNKWFLEKEIISTWCYHPVFKEIVNFKIHIGELFPEGFTYIDPEFINGELRKTKHTISLENRLNEDFAPCAGVNEDFSNEIKKYVTSTPDPKDGNTAFYIYIETYRKGLKLPEYYSLILFDYDFIDKLELNSINKQNDYKLYYFHNDDFDERMFLSDVTDVTKYTYFEVLNSLHDLTNEIFSNNIIQINKIKYTYEKLKEAKKEGCLFYGYAVDAYNSIVDYLINKRLALKCEHCNQVMEYAPTKKYCSLNTDGQDCGKKARNARNYQRSKLK